MSKREVIVLGTASQVPTRHRNHNGYLVRWDAHGMLFDPGEGTQRQMIFSGVSASAITRIFVTHFHGDHCLGLAGICQRLSLDGVTRPVPVHYPASGEVYYRRLRHASIYVDNTDIRPAPIAADGVIAEEPDLTISTAKLDHTVESWGYRIDEPDGWTIEPGALKDRGIQGPEIGVLLKRGEISTKSGTVRIDEVARRRKGQSLAFVMDTRDCSGARTLARDVDMLVIESTYLESEAQEARDRGHLTALQAATIGAESGARQVVLTHFSQRHPDTSAFLREAEVIHPHVVAVRDGDRVALPRRHRVLSSN